MRAIFGNTRCTTVLLENAINLGILTSLSENITSCFILDSSIFTVHNGDNLHSW